MVLDGFKMVFIGSKMVFDQSNFFGPIKLFGHGSKRKNYVVNISCFCPAKKVLVQFQRFLDPSKTILDLQKKSDIRFSKNALLKRRINLSYIIF